MWRGAICTGRSGRDIYRADLDGSKIEIEIPDRPNIEILDWSNIEILVTGLDDPRGLALDVASGHMYWTDTDLGAIHVRT